MHDTPQRHHRRSIRLRGYDYSRAGAYFVTVCTHNRECLFGEIVDREMVLNDAGKIVADEWMKIAKIRNEIELDQWIVMPNHIHGILVINDPVGAIHESPLQMTVTQRRNMALPKLIGRFKMLSSKGINEMRGTPGRPVWQRNYYEHVIRNDDEMNRAREYIINNPAKWALDRENPVGACCNVPLQPHPTQPQAPEWETA
jgi:REP element-mobilizing transposase RayT